ncbi:MAG: B-box zinc finger protein, partial [Planctomycetota bacterium]
MLSHDDRLAQLALREGKATVPQLTEARELVSKMAELGVKRDLLGALVDREVLTSEEADRLRSLAAAAEGGGTPGEAAEAPSAHVASPPALEAEAVEEAELVAGTTAPPAAGASSPVGPPSAAQAGPAEGAGALAEGPGPGGEQAASGGSWQASCSYHPDRVAMRKCRACGKPLCSECVVQTPDGIFCGESCFVGFSPSGGERRVVAASPEPGRRRAWPMVAVVVLVPVVIVAAVYLRPSKALKKARLLKTKVLDLEAKGQTEKALEAAKELASMPRKGRGVGEVVSWGGSRSKVLKRKIGLAAVGNLRKGLAALATGDQNGLTRKRRELDALSTKFSDVGEVTQAIDKMRGDVDGRLSAARASAKAPKRGGPKRAGAAAVPAARPRPLKRLPSMSKLRADVDRFVKARRFAEAKRAVEKFRLDVGASASRSFLAQLARLEANTISAARNVYQAEDKKAQALVSKGSFKEARGVYRRLIDEVGIDEITVTARKAIESVDRAERTAHQRADLQKAAEVIAKARQQLDSYDYALAQAVLESARRGLETEAARAEIDLWLDIAGRELAVLRKIVQMIGTKPVDLETLQSGAKGKKGVMFKADAKGYSVRV